MGFLNRLRARRDSDAFRPPTAPENWRSTDEWLHSWGPPLNIVAGENRRQPELRELAQCEGRCLRLVDVTLRPEPENPVDSEAIAAYVGLKQVGYLRREIAAAIQDGCAGAGVNTPTFVVAGVLRGGWDAHSQIGAHIWIDRTVTPGPVIAFADGASEFEVGWPPHPDELQVLSR